MIEIELLLSSFCFFLMLGNNPRLLQSLSSGIAENQVCWAAEQSAFGHEMARLLKYWSKFIPFQGFMNSQSFIFELIAFAFAMDMQQRRRKCDHSECFQNILEYFCHIRDMGIRFLKENKVKIYKQASNKSSVMFLLFFVGFILRPVLRLLRAFLKNLHTKAMENKASKEQLIIFFMSSFCL